MLVCQPACLTLEYRSVVLALINKLKGLSNCEV